MGSWANSGETKTPVNNREMSKQKGVFIVLFGSTHKLRHESASSEQSTVA
jgi:hypothetical protein